MSRKTAQNYTPEALLVLSRETIDVFLHDCNSHITAGMVHARQFTKEVKERVLENNYEIAYLIIPQIPGTKIMAEAESAMHPG